MNNLKLITVLAFWMFATAGIALSQTPEEKYLKANSLYNEKQYEKSIAVYNDLIRSGYFSDEIYYNLGNAFFRNNDPASAIWCFEKCLLLNAAHDDARANLDFVNRLTLNNQEIVPENFLSYAWNSLSATMSWRHWAIAFLASLALFLISIVVFLISASNRNRRIFFVASIIVFICAMIALTQSITGKYNIMHSHKAIVVREAVQLKSSPDKRGTALAMIQPGIKVHIAEFKTPWLKVITPDGTQGWVPEEGVVRLNAVSPIPVE